MYKSDEEAMQAVNEFARWMLKAQTECGIADAVIAVRVNVNGKMLTFVTGSGDMHAWRGMMETACEWVWKADGLIATNQYDLSSEEDLDRLEGDLGKELKG